MAARELTPEEVARFHADGFLVVEGLLGEDDMAQVEAAFVRTFERVKAVASDPGNAPAIKDAVRAGQPHIIVHGANGSRYTYQTNGAWDERTEASMDTLSVRHVAWCGKDEPALKAMGRHPAILSLAAQLLGLDRAAADAAGGEGAAATQMICQAHFKAPRDGVAFPWHQDSMHRRMAQGDFADVNGRGSYVQVIVAVEDTAADAGPVSFIAGSGRRGHLGGTAGLDPATVDALLGACGPAAPVATPLLKRGSAVCLNPYVVHGSQPNASDGWRRTFINGFAYPGEQRGDRKSVV